jgi:hypothetical protein
VYTPLVLRDLLCLILPGDDDPSYVVSELEKANGCRPDEGRPKDERNRERTRGAEVGFWCGTQG